MPDNRRNNRKGGGGRVRRGYDEGDRDHRDGDDGREYEDDLVDTFDDTVTSVVFQNDLMYRPHRGPGTATAK